MNISILIPSKNNPERLKQNINKSSFGGIFNKVNYYILVDSDAEKKKYLDIIKNRDVSVINKLFNYQTQRYIYLLNMTKSDFYMIASDDIFFEARDDDIKININKKVLHSINENNYIINHPIISDSVKNKIIKLFSNYNLKYLCIDTIISFMFSKNEKTHLPFTINHMSSPIDPNKFDYYINDILEFFKIIFLKGYFIRNISFNNFKIIYSLILDLLSAYKNRFLRKIKKK